MGSSERTDDRVGYSAPADKTDRAVVNTGPAEETG